MKSSSIYSGLRTGSMPPQIERLRFNLRAARPPVKHFINGWRGKFQEEEGCLRTRQGLHPASIEVFFQPGGGGVLKISGGVLDFGC